MTESTAGTKSSDEAPPNEAPPEGSPDHKDPVEVAEKRLKKDGWGLTAGFLAVFLFIHVLAVSGWKWETAADIADSFNFDDSISIVFGTLFELPVATGLITSLILPIVIFRIYWTRKNEQLAALIKDLFIAGGILSTQYVLINSFNMWWPTVLGLILLVILLILSRVWVKGKGAKFIANIGRHVGTLLLLCLVVLGLVVDTPWMPRERLETNDGVMTGHVLEVTPGFVKLLTDDREVVILISGDVKSRETLEKLPPTFLR